MKCTTIHVIDDDPAVRASICAFLRARDHDVIGYSSALEFLASCDLASPAVLITDLAMTELSGEELQRRLLQQQSPIAVIVVSGAADVKAAVRVMEGGAVTLLEKPFAEQDLLSAVSEGMNRSWRQYHVLSERKTLDQKLASLAEDDQIVLTRMIAGKSIKSCSAELHLSTRTIERKRRAILELMGVDSIPELAILMERVYPGRYARSLAAKD
jgi:two-component system response regulator FixJ